MTTKQQLFKIKYNPALNPRLNISIDNKRYKKGFIVAGWLALLTPTKFVFKLHMLKFTGYRVLTVGGHFLFFQQRKILHVIHRHRLLFYRIIETLVSSSWSIAFVSSQAVSADRDKYQRLEFKLMR